MLTATGPRRLEITERWEDAYQVDILVANRILETTTFKVKSHNISLHEINIIFLLG